MSTATFSQEEEGKLWDAKVIGTSSPKALQRAVFFYIGKVFCIRGGEKQRKLGPSNFMRTSEPECYTYVKHGSKNKVGGLAQLRLENKRVPCVAVPDMIPRCLVHLLDLYLNKLPQWAFDNDVLHYRPKQHTPVSDKIPWYDVIPVGKNKLSSMVKDMCKDCGIEEKTNHSTGASAMFQANVPEKIIQNTTGHRSLDALRKYERTSIEQHQAASKVLMTGKSETQPAPTQQHAGTGLRNIFGNLTKCSIGSITINIIPSTTTTTVGAATMGDDLDYDIDDEALLSLDI